MGGLLNAVRGALGRSGQGQSDNTDSGVSKGPGKENDPGKSSERLQFIQGRWEDLKNAYIVYHQSIWQSLLFYANQSWIDWDDARKVWYPLTPSDDWVPRPRINRFSPTVDAVASNLYKVPEVEATPTPDDDPDANSVSWVCNELARYCLKKEGLKVPKGTQDDKSGSAAQQFVLCGGVFTIIRAIKKALGQTPRRSTQQSQGYTCQTCDEFRMQPVGQPAPKFCPECGQPVEPEDMNVVADEADEQGQPIMDENSEYDLCIDIGNNLWAFPRGGATSMEDSPFFLWAQRQTLDSIYFRWDGFEAEPDAVWPDGYSVTYEHAMAFWYTGYSSSTMQVKDACMVLEMYVQPNKVKDHPEGMYGVVINDKLAHEDKWTFPEHPCTMGKYLHLPQIFFARSIAFDLVELQRELNSYESVIKLHAMTSAVDPVVVDMSSKVGEITGRSDRVIYWRSIGPNSEPPHRMGAGHLDDGVYKQRDNLHAEFQNVSMAVNAFRGQQEGAVTASSAISQLRSQAELMFSKPVGNWNNLWCDTVRKYVKFIQFYFTVTQIAAIVGPGREQEIMLFKSADLDTMTEWIPSQHGLPRTRDERRQELMTMWDKGALDLNQPSVRAEVFELFGETGMMHTFNQDATNARLENTEIKNGAGWMQQVGPAQGAVPKPDGSPASVPMPGPKGQVIPPIVPMPEIEDLAVHLYFHKDQAKSRDFQKWPGPAKQALIAHILATQQAIDQEQLKQIAKAALAGAKPGGGGGGGPAPAAPGKGPGPGASVSQSQVQGQAGATASQGQGVPQ